MYVTIISLIYHSNSNKHTSLGIPFLQCSCAFHCKMCTKLLLHSFCCAFHGLAICTIFSSSILLNLLSCAFLFTGHASFFCWCAFCGFATCATLFHNGHSLHLYPFSPYLKHSTFTTPTLLIILSSTPHCITLLFNTSNLFWDIVIPFSASFYFLQFQTRCPNPLQPKHNFPLLPSSSFLSLVRECFSLSKLLMIELYCSKDMVVCL